MGKIVYFAGPLFTQAEKVWNRKLTAIIEKKRKDFKVFLPQVEVAGAVVDGIVDFKKIQQICLTGIDSSDFILAILDGSDSDSGTSFECGYAYSQGKKIIGVRTDIRGSEDQGLNAMLNQSCHSVVHYEAGGDSVDNIESLAELIIEEIERIGYPRATDW